MSVMPVAVTCRQLVSRGGQGVASIRAIRWRARCDIACVVRAMRSSRCAASNAALTPSTPTAQTAIATTHSTKE